MRPTPPRSEPLEATSWALNWETDRRDDQRALRVGMAFAVLMHAALLLVRLADDSVILPPVDAVVHPELRNFTIKKREPAPVPRPVEQTPRPEVVRIPVPIGLAPPEPLPMREAPIFPVELPPSPVFIAAIPDPPAIAPQGPVRFTGEMERPIRLAGLDPTYTELARKVREEGVVILDAVIEATGEVAEIGVIKALGFGLTESAVRAVETWHFQPARLDGRPIAVRYTLTVRFSLR